MTDRKISALRAGAPLGAVLCFSAAALLSCATATERLAPPRSSAETRLEDIQAAVPSAPERAIHLIGSFRSRYGDELSADDGARLDALHREAVAGLEAAFAAARDKRDWLSAASYSRSLRAVGSASPRDSEAALMRSAARDFLAAGDEVPAFLAYASTVPELPLESGDLKLFLDRAIESKQRRTAAYFVERAAAAGLEVPAAAAEYARGKDAPSDMIKGVATVWVDRGIKIEKGVGMPDRVIGSAFFIDRKGYLITNYHVIQSEVDPEYEGFSRAYIRLGDASKPRIPIKVVGWDPVLDLALIKAEIEPEFVFSVLDEASLDPGERVLAIGSPAGLESTVTAGIVSATGRRFLQLGEVVQIDAAVNHGNSGGPVVDSDGRLAGVVFAGIEQFEGLNFAVPISRLAAALPALYRGGKVSRPWLGFALHQDDAAIEVVYVSPGTPAADLRIPEGSFIESLDGRAAKSISDLQDILLLRRAGELVRLKTTDGAEYALSSAERPKTPLEEASRRDTRERLSAPLFGLILAPAGGGMFDPDFTVKRVLRGSVADEAGLSENDPVSVKGFRVEAKAGYAVIDLFVKKRRMGYLESTIRLPAALESPDTL